MEFKNLWFTSKSQKIKYEEVQIAKPGTESKTDKKVKKKAEKEAKKRKDAVE